MGGKRWISAGLDETARSVLEFGFRISGFGFWQLEGDKFEPGLDPACREITGQRQAGV